jgi:hypothetical protein
LKLSDFTALSVGLGAHPIDFAADMRLRGLTGARDEFHLAAIVQNLKTMALAKPIMARPFLDSIDPIETSATQ